MTAPEPVATRRHRSPLRRLAEQVRARDWVAVAIELAIVVAGILLALQISEWNEARDDRAREREYLARVVEDLGQSIGDLERGMALSQQREARCRLLMDAVHDEGPVRADPPAFLVALYTCAWSYTAPVRSHAFDELRSSGQLGLIADPALRLAITEFYTEVRKDDQWDYIREQRQNEYDRRVAGILTYPQVLLVSAGDEDPSIGVEDALGLRARMLDRPDFIAWLPTVADRFEERDNHRAYRERAQALRDRIVAALDPGAAP